MATPYDPETKDAILRRIGTIRRIIQQAEDENLVLRLEAYVAELQRQMEDMPLPS